MDTIAHLRDFAVIYGLYSDLSKRIIRDIREKHDLRDVDSPYLSKNRLYLFFKTEEEAMTYKNIFFESLKEALKNLPMERHFIYKLKNCENEFFLPLGSSRVTVRISKDKKKERPEIFFGEDITEVLDSFAKDSMLEVHESDMRVADIEAEIKSINLEKGSTDYIEHEEVRYYLERKKSCLNEALEKGHDKVILYSLKDSWKHGVTKHLKFKGYDYFEYNSCFKVNKDLFETLKDFALGR